MEIFLMQHLYGSDGCDDTSAQNVDARFTTLASSAFVFIFPPTRLFCGSASRLNAFVTPTTAVLLRQPPRLPHSHANELDVLVKSTASKHYILLASSQLEKHLRVRHCFCVQNCGSIVTVIWRTEKSLKVA